MEGRRIPIRAVCFAAVAVTGGLIAHPATAQAPQAIISQYCIGCHNSKTRTAGVVLEGIDFAQPRDHAALLEKVLRKVQTGEMPPAGLPRPDRAAAAQFTASITESLDRAAAEHPHPGRPAIHRLNRAEYSNAIRDLLALDIRPGDLLPVDDSGYGFDNIADVLTISPALLERYLSAARLVSRLAVGDMRIQPFEEEFLPASVRRAGGSKPQANQRASDDLPFDSAGGMSFSYYFPLDGEYIIRVRAGKSDEKSAHNYEVTETVKAGLRTVSVAFLRESAKLEIEIPPVNGSAGVRRGPSPPPAEMDLRLDGVAVKRFEVPRTNTILPAFRGVTITGPYNPSGPGDTTTRRKLFICHPVSADEAACAQSILSSLARRAFRRPVTGADIAPLMRFYQTGRQQWGFETGIEQALRAMLVSPDFLFRVEHDPKGAAPGTVYRLNDFELASRLSFFLWSSIPDDRLLDLAEKGELKKPAVLNREVRRMLADRKSQALVENFAGQWLALRNLEVVRPDAKAFPQFDEALREGLQQETTLFFESILREDRPVTDLLQANYTFLNQRVAELYGIPGVYGAQFRRVELDNPERGGLLGQGSILTLTSYPNRTSVVQRGKWILETLLGTPPPPPPANVPELKAQSQDGRTLNMRQQMEQHRANPACAGCHMRMDPLGFAMENYDGIGKWRARDGEVPIDASGRLPDGTLLEGPAGLRRALTTAHRDEFVSTLIEKMLTYALGRGAESYDKPVVRSIAAAAARDDYRITAIIGGIIGSTPFQMRETRKP
jgi:cytochrome c551/c552